MAEVQPNKTCKKSKSQWKRVRAQERKGRMTTESGPVNPDVSSNSNQLEAMEVPVAEQPECKLSENNSSDAEDTSNEDMTEVEDGLVEIRSFCIAPEELNDFFPSQRTPEVSNDVEIVLTAVQATTPPHMRSESDFRVPDYCVQQATTTATQHQIDAMINFMCDNKELARGQLRNTNGRLRSKRLWEGLCNALNSMGGCTKTVEQWQRVWADKKHLAKKAAIAAKRTERVGGCATPGLSQMELRILSIMEEGNGERQTSAREPAVPMGPPVTKQEPGVASPPQAPPADQVFEEHAYPSMSPDPLEVVMPILNQQRPRNMRNGVEQDENYSRRMSVREYREQVLFNLQKAEREWMLKAAKENYYKAKAEKEAAEDLQQCNFAKKMEAELRLAILRTQTDHF